LTIAALMGAIVVLGVILAALRYPNRVWASVCFSISLGVLVFALLGVLFHRGLPRTFWSGFALTGWLYFVATLSPWVADQIAPLLFTTAFLDLIYPHVAASEKVAVVSPAASSAGGAIGLGGGFGGPSPEDLWAFWTQLEDFTSWNGFNKFQIPRSITFQMIGHSIFVLLFAYLGGVTARRFARLGASAAVPPQVPTAHEVPAAHS
jgi:hypothetical protein